MRKSDKAEDGAAVRGSQNPDPPADGQTPFERFRDFARKVVSVPKGEIDERERAYRQRGKPRPGPA
jgi:hypothetical protein